MASSDQKQELVHKVTQLINAKFGGDWDRAFDHYAKATGSGALLERTDLLEVLEEAGIGSWMTRGMWADGVIKELDLSGDKSISRHEFRSALEQSCSEPK